MNISRIVAYVQIFAIVALSCLFFAQTANALSVVATVPVSFGPAAVTYDSSKDEVFVANFFDNTVSVIDDTTNNVTATIPVGSGPIGVTYDSSKGEVFVTNFFDNTVSVIDDTNNNVTATIPVGSSPRGIAYDSGKAEIFVSNSADNTVSVIDDTNNNVTATIPVGSSPLGIAYDSGKAEIFVANNIAGTVSVIDDTTNTVTATIPVGSGVSSSPFGIAYDSTMNEMFVANNNDNTVSVITDANNNVTATIPVGSAPIGIGFDSAMNEMFVANNNDNTVSVVADTDNTVVATIPIGSGSYAVAYDIAMHEIFVSNQNDNTVSVISNPVIPGGSGHTPQSTGGHDVTIYHPPSLGNDYYHHYSDGLRIQSKDVTGAGFNGKSFEITKYGSTIPQQVLQIGQSVIFTFKIYDERGPDTISHVGMYVHFKGDVIVTNSDTSVVWDKHDGITVTDSEKSFSNVTVSEHHDDNFAYVSIKFTPTKTMPDSSILMRMWDDKRASIDLPIWGAIIVVDPNAPIPVKEVPSNQYGDYNALVSLLDLDGYQKPAILYKIKSGSDLSPMVNVYWVYDKGAEKLVMMETFKDGTIIGDTAFNLVKKSTEPTLTDHAYVYIPVQNNRQNHEQEKAIMHQEEVKAKKILESMHVNLLHATDNSQMIS